MTRRAAGSRLSSSSTDPVLGLLAHVHGTLREAAEALVDAVGAVHDLPLAVVIRSEGSWIALASSRPVPVSLLTDGPDRPESASAWTWILGGGSVALLVPSDHDDDLDHETLLACAAWLRLHGQRDAARGSEQTALEEADVVRAVTEQLRSVRDLDEVLHSIARRTLSLLDADICGVLLREDDQLLMRSCVGNRVAETSKLVMHPGEGVAGLVFQTGAMARVDDYLASEEISPHFMELASREDTRSALAVPLTLRGDLIGVLEVWRRRASVFSDLDVQRLSTLADFATIAIANARLYEEQEGMLDELGSTRTALEKEVQLSRRIANLQQRLIDAVLRRPTLAALAETVADELDCAVGIYGPEGQPLALISDRRGRRMPGQVAPTDLPHRRLPDATGDGHISPVVVEGESLGSVLLLGHGETADLLSVACNQVALAVSLAHLHERAASKARAEALDQAMWDLLSGPIEARMAARSRAQQIGVSLSGPHVVAYGKVNGVGSSSDPSSLEQTVGELTRAFRHTDGAPKQTLFGARGDHVVVVLPITRGLDLRELLSDWSSVAHATDPQLSITWGASTQHEDPFALAKAFDEAKVALSAARRMGAHNVALYDELGIVRLLLGSGSDPDLQSFVDEVTGPLMKYDAEHDGALIQTLRAFFDANCSQKVAAERLFIHHKTMKYRLDRIFQLTGLDLSKHEDRMRADFALRLLQVHTQEGGPELSD